MASTLKSKTAHGMFWGGFSNGMLQVLNLIFGIFLARMLSPEDYGLVAMLTIFTLVGSTLQESGFIAALTNKKEINHNDYNSVCWFSIGMGVILYIILFLAAPWIADFFNEPRLIPLSRYVFLGIILSALGTAQSAYLFKQLMVKQRAIAQITALIISGTISIVMAANGFSYWGLATQNLVYVAVSTSLIWYFSPWRPTFHFDFTPLREMITFSFKLLITRIFGHINNNLFTIILGRLCPPQVVGYYNQGYKWSSMGGLTILGMISSVAQPVLASVKGDLERRRRVFGKMLEYTAFITFPAMFGLGLIAHEFILLTITEKWLPSVPVIKLLCISGAFVPITHLHQQVVISNGKSGIYMYTTIAAGIAFTTGSLSLYAWGLEAMLTGYVTVALLLMIAWHLLVRREIGFTTSAFLHATCPYAAMAIATMTASHYLTTGIESNAWCLLAKIASAVTIYAGMTLLFRRQLAKEIWNEIKERRKGKRTQQR